MQHRWRQEPGQETVALTSLIPCDKQSCRCTAQMCSCCGQALPCTSWGQRREVVWPASFNSLCARSLMQQWSYQAKSLDKHPEPVASLPTFSNSGPQCASGAGKECLLPCGSSLAWGRAGLHPFSSGLVPCSLAHAAVLSFPVPACGQIHDAGLASCLSSLQKGWSCRKREPDFALVRAPQFLTGLPSCLLCLCTSLKQKKKKNL